jgi:hypothetical protein
MNANKRKLQKQLSASHESPALLGHSPNVVIPGAVPACWRSNPESICFRWEPEGWIPGSARKQRGRPRNDKRGEIAPTTASFPSAFIRVHSRSFAD